MTAEELREARLSALDTQILNATLGFGNREKRLTEEVREIVRKAYELGISDGAQGVISTEEAAKLLGLSRRWVRDRERSLEKQGRGCGIRVGDLLVFHPLLFGALISPRATLRTRRRRHVTVTSNKDEAEP